jgi:cytochrome P450 family 4
VNLNLDKRARKKMFLFSVVVVFITWLVLFQLKNRRRNQLLSKIPSPRKYPIVHNAIEFVGKSPKQIFKWIEQMSNELGSVYHFTVSPFDMGKIFVRDPKIFETILTSQKNLNKTQAYQLLRPWLGEGLLVSEANKWRQRRKILNPAFHFNVLEKFVAVMEKQSNILCEILLKFDGKEINIVPLINLFALDVISGE